MGNLYRFVEPVLLLLLKKKGRSYGYELASELHPYALTDSVVEVAALYKTLRQLEQNDCVTSEWDVAGSGPARRVYALTVRGEQHLDEWTAVLGHMSKAMARFVKAAQASSTNMRPGNSKAARRERGAGQPVSPVPRG